SLVSLALKLKTRFWWIRSGDTEGVNPLTGHSQTGAEHGARMDRMIDEESFEGGVSVGTAAVGPFLCMSTLCIVCAFLLGAYTDIPSYRAFCLTGALCVIFLFVFHFCF